MKIKQAYEIQHALEYAEANDNVDAHEMMLQVKWVKLSDVEAIKKKLYELLMPDLSGKTQKAIEIAFNCVDLTKGEKHE
jgi:hypothetical protein